LLRLQIGAGLLLALYGAGAFFDQILGAGSLLLSELQLATDFWRDRKASGRHERIVGRFKMADVQPVSETTDQCDQEHANADDGEHPMLAKTVSP